MNYVPWIGIGLFAVFEFSQIARHKPTISQTVWKYSKLYPFIPFIFGALMDHFKFLIPPGC